VWTLPGERAKNGLAHEVPLSEPASRIIAASPHIGRAGFVLTVKGEKPIGAYAYAKSKLDALMLEIARDEARLRGSDPEQVQIKPWVFHDLRRTAATRMVDLGVSPHVVEAILNHVSGHKAGVAGIYNRAQYRAEKRAALELWADHITKLVAPAK